MATERNSSQIGMALPEIISDSAVDKVMLKKRPRPSAGNFEHQKRYHFFSRGSRRPQHQQENYVFKFENSADILYPVGDYIEHSTKSYYTNIGSPLSSDICSFSLNGTPVSRTKRFNHNFQAWFNKFQYYSRRSPFHRSKSERTDFDFINEKILSTPVEDLPEDAYSCYNQYRTRNFTNVFDTLHIEKQNNATRVRNIDVPIFSPLNDLTFEQLQEFKEHLFGIPPFSEGSVSEIEHESKHSLKISEVFNPDDKNLEKAQNANLIFNPSDFPSYALISNHVYASKSIQGHFDCHSNEVETENSSESNEKSQVPDETSAVAKPDLCSSLINPSSASDSNVKTPAEGSNSLISISPLNSIEETPPLNSTDSCPPLVDSTESQPVGSTNSQSTTPTPELIRKLYDDTIETGEEYELNSAQFEIVDSLSIQDAVLTSLEPNNSLSLQRSRSVLQRVMSVFRGEQTINSDIQSNSSNSTYSPISIVVPALKQNHSIIADIAENISEGQPIGPYYHPDYCSANAADDENQPIDIKDPKSYEFDSNDSLTSAESPRSLESRLSTIKFDKFAQLLLYDGSKRSKYYKVKHQFPPHHHPAVPTINTLSNRSNLYKNRGSLSLSPTLSPGTVSKLKSLGFSKFSKFSKVATVSSNARIDDIVESFDDSYGSSGSVRPILKCRENRNADIELLRAKYCDEVEVEDFIDFFEDFEKQRMISEPFLERVRERQLLTYYISEDSSSPTTNDSTFDA